MCNAIHLPLRFTAIVVFNILNTFPNYFLTHNNIYLYYLSYSPAPTYLSPPHNIY